ncbi:hypothetical protein G5B88_12675 [Herbaspirillum seropedicae]|uniref:hypothetical protein n=1 Tax=Herbaspirillum seropedicae TaxID=964 RepID=UPI000308A740|nr:hypothetical protein [Herbaspirillum seropedicae]AKN68232.1 hypothetical protein ACP92_12520 [Herbaspirillum seropedicae]NQE29251.1 hypothetical protein [Herbaspirillum seropedicae]UMU21960.1 hypothetical protein G5B88_12675 [Herbaspirillum seropedicae]
MSQLNQGQLAQNDQLNPAQAAASVTEDLQHVNDDAAAARHLTAIRIRGQLAEVDGELQQG